MWFKKLKKKKLQCFLIGVLMFLSSLIFTSSLSFVTAINSYVQKYYDNEKNYNMVVYNANEGCKNDILDWCKNNSEIENCKFAKTYGSGNNVYYNGEKLKITEYDVIPLKNYKNLPYSLSKLKSLNDNLCPKEGEIWVTQLFADNYKVSLGDSLKLKINDHLVSYKISSIVNDALQPSSLMSQIILYTNENSVNEFSSFAKMETVFINTQKDADTKELSKKLQNSIKTDGFIVDKTLFVQYATMLSSLVGGVSALASLFVFIVSVFLIRFIIWNNILKEYKSIGIYKALGFNKREILGFYIFGYSLTAAIGSILGAASSIPVINYTAAKVIKYIGNFNGVSISLEVILLTIILFTFIVILNLCFVIKRTNKITPVDALRTGVTSSRKNLTKSLIKNNSSALALAVNDIFKYKKIAISIAASLCISLSLIIFFGDFSYTISKMKENSNIWFSIPKSSVTVSTWKTITDKQLNNLLSDVTGDKRVKNYVYGCWRADNVKLDIKKCNIKSSLYAVEALNSYDSDMNFSINNGHNPGNNTEVAVTTNILKDSGLSVGDYIELNVNNKKVTYLISGSFCTVMSNGYVIRMLNSEIEKEDKNYKYNEIFLNLNDNTFTDKYEQELNNKYSYASANDIDPDMKYTIDSIPGTIVPISYLLITVFIIFSIIIVFNVIIMNLHDNRRNFGIMKALGFTSSEIRNRYLYRIAILTGISSIAAVMLNIMFSKSIAKAVMNGMDVLIVSPCVISAAAAAMFILVILTVLMCSNSIKDTKPNELIEE